MSECPSPKCTDGVPIDGSPFCADCAGRIADALGRLLRDYVDLMLALAPGSSGGEPVGGTRDAPLPLRVDALSLAQDIAGALCDMEDGLRRAHGLVPAGRLETLWRALAGNGDVLYQGPERNEAERIVEAEYAEANRLRRAAVEDERLGYVEVAIIERADADVCDRSRVAWLRLRPTDEPRRRDAVTHPSESRQLDAAVRFLTVALPQLLDGPAGTDAGLEILELHDRARVLLGLARGDVPLPTPCPNLDCGKRALVRRNGKDYVECDRRRGGCGLIEKDLRRLVRVLAVDMPDLLLPAVRAADLVGVSRSAIVKWTERHGLTSTACDVRSRRPLYRAGDVLHIATNPRRPRAKRSFRDSDYPMTAAKQDGCEVLHNTAELERALYGSILSKSVAAHVAECRKDLVWIAAPSTARRVGDGTREVSTSCAAGDVCPAPESAAR